jgi:hypothetical protein
VGHHPRVVDAVPGEATAELVVDAASGHGVEGGIEHRPFVGTGTPTQEL